MNTGDERRKVRSPRRLAVVLGGTLLFACSKRSTPPPRVEDHVAGRERIYAMFESRDRELADAMIEDRWTLPRFEEVRLERPLSWSEDPFKEKYWRFIFYSLRPLRHVLSAYTATEDPRYRDYLVGFLRELVEGAPTYKDSVMHPGHRYMYDEHTAAFRTMMLVDIYWKLKLRDALPEDLEAPLLKRIDQLGSFLAADDNFEGHSNHGVTEANALLLVAVNFPKWSSSAGRRALALRRLAQLVKTTVDEDGAQIEQSPGYHFYVMEMFWRTRSWATMYGVALPEVFAERLPRMADFAGHITLPNGMMPELGATSRKSAVRNYKKFNKQVGRELPHYAFLLGQGKEGEPPPQRSKLFSVAGFAVIRAGSMDPKRFRQMTHVIFDVGPFRTAHSDLDALSLHVYSDGEVLLCDAGFYTLEAGRQREYFHGTRGHNTVVVDGGDQKRGSATHGELVQGDTWTSLAGAHELYKGVTHERSVLLVDRGILVVVDRLRSDDDHLYEQVWHLREGHVAENSPTGLRVRDGEGVLKVVIDQARSAAPATLVTGVEEPVYDGWIAHKYEQAQPATVAKFPTRARSAEYVTLLRLGEQARVDGSVQIDGDWARGTVTVQSGDRSWRIELDNGLMRPTP